MNAAALKETVGLGVITGMRSMAGPTALAVRHDGVLSRLVPVLAIGEMIADKTSLVGNRIDAFPLAGRAVMGGLVGGAIAREQHGNIVLGALLGASAAVIAAHLAYHARKRLPVSTAVGGIIEDGIVLGIAALLRPAGRR
jgi:uncharacterized membrane protein